jgi:hypothetical protein
MEKLWVPVRHPQLLAERGKELECRVRGH